MDPSPPAPTSTPVWQVVLCGLVFCVLYLGWAYGFDMAMRAITGTWIEAVLNWIATSWLWFMVGCFVLAVVVGSIFRK